MCPKDEDRMAKGVDPDQRSSLMWVYTVYPDLYFLHIRQGFPRFSPILDISILYEGVGVRRPRAWRQGVIDRCRTEYFLIKNVHILA